MDGSRELCEKNGSCELEIEESEADDPSPYDSDTESVDLDEFVKSLSHDVNQWRVYPVEDFKLEKIGDGFFGDIYKATDWKTNNVVVMKTMKKATKTKLMCAEIRLMCRLKHPNILSFIGVCIDKSIIHLLTKYMDTGNLEEVVSDLEQPLPWSLRMKLSHDIAKGMEYLHGEGVIHRDLASKNILISNESGGYLAVVGDFGLAAKIPSRKKRLKVVGSPFWMAPEVINHDQYNETVDIFSYGIILCEIIGRVHSNPEELPRTNQFGLDVDKFREQVEGCPPEFLQLAVCCCQLDPESRPPFEITSSFLEYIRQLTIVEGSPTKLMPDKCNGNARKSANIEDWLIDKKKVTESSPKTSPCSDTCACKDGAPVVANGVNEMEKPTGEEQPSKADTPCNRRHSNKRNSFFSGLRYKYFRPTVVTEDLVNSTPSKLAWFFNRVIHVQKKHRFEGRKKRSKTTDFPDAAERPRLRSYRLFGGSKDRSASDVQQRHPVNSQINETEESARSSNLSSDQNDVSNSSTVRFVESLQNSALVSDISSDIGRPSRRASCSTSSPTPDDCYQVAVFPVSSDQVNFNDSIGVEKEERFLMSWPQASLRDKTSISKDTNEFHDMQEPIPRCLSESDVHASNKTKSSKPRRFLVRQHSNVTKNKKYLNFLNFFRKHPKGKQNT